MYTEEEIRIPPGGSAEQVRTPPLEGRNDCEEEINLYEPWKSNAADGGKVDKSQHFSQMSIVAIMIQKVKTEKGKCRDGRERGENTVVMFTLQ